MEAPRFLVKIYDSLLIWLVQKAWQRGLIQTGKINSVTTFPMPFGHVVVLDDDPGRREGWGPGGTAYNNSAAGGYLVSFFYEPADSVNLLLLATEPERPDELAVKLDAQISEIDLMLVQPSFQPLPRKELPRMDTELIIINPVEVSTEASFELAGQVPKILPLDQERIFVRDAEVSPSTPVVVAEDGNEAVFEIDLNRGGKK
jgi:hypothetical protein